MKRKNRKMYAFWIALSEGVGILSGLLSMGGMTVYESVAVKPAFTPPSWVFPVVWTALFALMGIAAARVSLAPVSRERSWGLNLYITQLAVNFFWPLFFFNLQAYGFALIWLILLWVLVLAAILNFRKVDETAAWLLVPYLAWLTFAAVLNAAVWILNA